MPDMQAISKSDPIMLGWEKYKATEEYANSRKWAAKEEHVDDSMWAAFLRGWTEAEHRMKVAALSAAIDSIKK